MKTSPILGLPIEETDDTRKDFPVRIDEPRTLAIEAALTTATVVALTPLAPWIAPYAPQAPRLLHTANAGFLMALVSKASDFTNATPQLFPAGSVPAAICPPSGKEIAAICGSSSGTEFNLTIHPDGSMSLNHTPASGGWDAGTWITINTTWLGG